MEVDPRHILGIKQDHGAYFEEVIAQCGLETKNIVIVLAVNSQYARYYQELINGLENYRRRGYQLALNFDYLAQALKFDYLPQESEAFDLMAKISPNYVSLSARDMADQVHDNILVTKLHQLKTRVASVGGQSILQQIDDKKSDLLARNAGFDLVEGGYYRSIAFDYLVPERKNHFSKKSISNPGKLFLKIFSVEEKSTYLLVYHPLFGIMPINHKFQAHLPCG